MGGIRRLVRWKPSRPGRCLGLYSAGERRDLRRGTDFGSGQFGCTDLPGALSRRQPMVFWSYAMGDGAWIMGNRFSRVDQLDLCSGCPEGLQQFERLLAIAIGRNYCPGCIGIDLPGILRFRWLWGHCFSFH